MESASLIFHWSLDTKETRSSLSFHAYWYILRLENCKSEYYITPKIPDTATMQWEASKKETRKKCVWMRRGRQIKPKLLNCLYIVLSTSTFPEILFQFQVWTKTSPQIMQKKKGNSKCLFVSATDNRSQLIHFQPTLIFSFLTEYIGYLILIKKKLAHSKK